MDDQQIMELYWLRREDAIAKTAEKYGSYCFAIAFRILDSRQDSEECVNDAYLRAWNAIPPKRPNNLAAFLGKITRNLALNRYEKNTAAKRGGGSVPLALEELQRCIPNDALVEETVINEDGLTNLLNQFLESLPEQTRKIFMCRYWHLYSVKEIAAAYGIGESKVKMALYRARKALKKKLAEGGFDYEK